MPKALCVGSQSGLTSGPKCFLDSMPCVLPYYAGGPGHIPLCEVCRGSSDRGELSQTDICPQSAECALVSHVLPTSMKRVAFQLFLTKSYISSSNYKCLSVSMISAFRFLLREQRSSLCPRTLFQKAPHLILEVSVFFMWSFMRGGTLRMCIPFSSFSFVGRKPVVSCILSIASPRTP